MFGFTGSREKQFRTGFTGIVLKEGYSYGGGSVIISGQAGTTSIGCEPSCEATVEVGDQIIVHAKKVATTVKGRPSDWHGYREWSYSFKAWEGNAPCARDNEKRFSSTCSFTVTGDLPNVITATANYYEQPRPLHSAWVEVEIEGLPRGRGLRRGVVKGSVHVEEWQWREGRWEQFKREIDCEDKCLAVGRIGRRERAASLTAKESVDGYQFYKWEGLYCPCTWDEERRKQNICTFSFDDFREMSVDLHSLQVTCRAVYTESPSTPPPSPTPSFTPTPSS